MISVDDYARWSKRARPEPKLAATLEGTLTLTCSPAELAAESERLAELWFESSAPRRMTARAGRRKRPRSLKK